MQVLARMSDPVSVRQTEYEILALDAAFHFFRFQSGSAVSSVNDEK